MANILTKISISVSGIIIAVYVLSLIKVMCYERKINNLYKELENKIQKEKERAVAMPFIEGAIKNLKEEYEPKIKELERKRRFILQKLPFIKK